nr:hypothetical protein [Brucella pseudintermedia]
MLNPENVRFLWGNSIFMETGEIREIGNPDSFFDNPGHPAARRFLQDIYH